MKNSGFLILAFLAFFSSGTVHAGEKIPITASKHRGPLNISNSFPATLFFLNYRPLRAENLDKGEYQIFFDVDEANTIVIDKSRDGTRETVLDSELTQYRFDLSAGLARRLEVGVSTAILHYHGPFMDGFIESVEGAAGKPSRVRKLVGKNDIRLYLVRDNQVMLDRSGSMAGFGDTVLRAKYALMEEKNKNPFDLSGRLEVKAPTGNKSKGMGSGSFDFGVSALGHKSFGNFHVQGDAAYLFIGDLELGGGYEPDNVFTGVFSTEYSWTKVSAILQFVYTQTALKNIGIPTLEEAGEAVSLGFKYDVANNTLFQFSMTENISDVTFSDFSLNAGIEYRFGKKSVSNKKSERKNRGRKI